MSKVVDKNRPSDIEKKYQLLDSLSTARGCSKTFPNTYNPEGYLSKTFQNTYNPEGYLSSKIFSNFPNTYNPEGYLLSKIFSKSPVIPMDVNLRSFLWR